MQATRGDKYAFIYFPEGRPAEIATAKVTGANLQAWWHDPRSGKSQSIGIFKKQKTATFNPPGSPVRGNDWILVLDDLEKKFDPPGEISLGIQ